MIERTHSDGSRFLASPATHDEYEEFLQRERRLREAYAAEHDPEGGPVTEVNP